MDRAACGSPFDVGVYHFRRTFTLATVPTRFVVHVSADNRYQLFVNGTRVAWGPARGHLSAWPYDTVDLAPWLRAGQNVLAAVVWNFGGQAPLAQHTWQTGLMVQGDTPAETVVDTSREWLATTNRAYTALPIDFGMVRGYWAAGPGERVDGTAYPWGWERPDFTASDWRPAVAGPPASPREGRDAASRHMLVPRDIPMMEERVDRIPRHREIATAGVPEGFAVPVPPRTSSVTRDSCTGRRLPRPPRIDCGGHPEDLLEARSSRRRRARPQRCLRAGVLPTWPTARACRSTRRLSQSWPTCPHRRRWGRSRRACCRTARSSPASIYFKYYVHQAVIRAGLGDRYLELLGEWRRMLDLGLTTWAEKAEPTRSDAHAWGASPNVEFLRTILGVDSAAPGFRRVAIAPHLGELTEVSGRVPHPKGFVDVALKRTGDALEATVTLPDGVERRAELEREALPVAGRAADSLDSVAARLSQPGLVRPTADVRRARRARPEPAGCRLQAA